ncbi:MAG: methyltransferase domain-containing protein [Microcella sp.]|uniref:class I SAM-dependent methyltransferase n=1 Tax=Microcella sp. TaxID=1913979 RepID=UPI0024CB418A|nr:class I SAM-dependent methyltransferase [Microcella sp.]UYN84463.1 MAG: methyltransferase domain-containing protein [Microcella sp.]
MAEFDESYWRDHWTPAIAHQNLLPVNPYVPAETAHLPRGTALDAGCGAGAEAIWLAEQGWAVTAADISRAALSRAQAHAVSADVDARIEWIETDLTRWVPQRTWDLVVTSYAHADIGQLAFYRRIASWVAPGGTVLIVGHGHGGHVHPDDATVTLHAITRSFSEPEWRIESSCESTRVVTAGNALVTLRDVVVRARRSGTSRHASTLKGTPLQ